MKTRTYHVGDIAIHKVRPTENNVICNKVEELETNLMSLVIFITLNICSTCFEH